MGEPSGAPPRGEDTSAPRPESTIRIESIRVDSDHGTLRGCDEPSGWRWSDRACPEPEWTAASRVPVSHTLGEKVHLALTLETTAATPVPVPLKGEGPGGILFRQTIPVSPGTSSVTLVSDLPLPRKLDDLSFDVRWSASESTSVVPAVTSLPLLITLGPPRSEPLAPYKEDGATPRRVAKAVEWAKRANSLDPHAIVESFLRRFPYYALLPNPDVPAVYDHPRYFNDVGGAWPMVEYVAASGECQAIVRLVRGMLAQIGAPGEARMLVVWADPDQGGGEKPLVDDWERNPRAGLSKTRVVDGKRLSAALVDGPVVEGKSYPPSHTRLPDGSVSPGLNRYEACLEFSHGGMTRYYCGGVGVLSSKHDILKVFWGLVWVEFLPDEGFRVEKIVRRYRGGEAPPEAVSGRHPIRSFLRRFARRFA
ncbi:hypothetical protein [Polyangium sorediatum]|uniref:Transglutaminase-like domain-containing protein n=1 Tax=Polyangium sorediatum TaxID=889274 RepID=A0ABT6P511_9BACT|nr:hypothetical protein [Polyangium sorediatum]MDI1435711.1 hypothetical protein [Polyangium sorediatum]